MTAARPGALRSELGIPPVGDIRNCIAALADAEPLMSELLGYRFPGGRREQGQPVETEPGGLGGHPIGNLLIAALTAVEGGDFEEGVRRMNRVLAVRGQVLPASPTPITLHARTRGGLVVAGQSNVMRTSDIERVWISPTDVAASEDALAAIAEADLIVLGPGSLYTSLLPVLLISRIRDAVAASSAVRVYVCNVATQAGETAAYDLADHVEALIAHTTPGLIDLVLANDRFDARVPAGWRAEPVRLRWPPARRSRARGSSPITSSTSTTPTITTRRGWPRRSSAPPRATPAAGVASAWPGPPDGGPGRRAGAWSGGGGRAVRRR